jgi:HK97 family phage major capsid protein
VKDIATLRDAVKAAYEQMSAALKALDARTTPATEGAFDEAKEAHDRACKALERAEALAEARAALPVEPNETNTSAERIAGEAARSGGSGVEPATATRTWDPKTQRVGGQPATYRMGNGCKHSWFKDQRAAKQGNMAAVERILASARELADVGKPMRYGNEHELAGEIMEERAIAETAGAGGELVAPLYLQEEYLKLARAARPYFDLLTKRPLPPNANSINIPRLKTGTKTETQKDLGNVESKDVTTGLLTFPVITVAGQEDFARQLFDRAIPELADMVVFPDLVADYLTKTDLQAISGNGVAPNAKGVLETVEAGGKVTYTSGSPELGALYSKIADAVQRIHTKRFLPASAIVMHPRRWAWCLAQLDAQKRPLIVPTTGGPFNVIGNLDNVAPEGFVGTVQGLPVYVDPSLPTTLGAGTNQDPIIVQRVEDSWVLEDEPIKTRVFEEVLSKELAIRAQVFNYLALTHERYAQSICVIEGTGLVEPTF